MARTLLVLLLWWIHVQAQPLVDYHQHFFSPSANKLSTRTDVVTATEMIAFLDEAGIRRALVLSLAYQYGNPNKPPVENEYERVKAENDWTSQQIARFPDRLRGFCSVNPLKDYALQEIDRCAKDPNIHYGLKLHFGNSDVQLENPQQVAKLQKVFAAANRHRMAIVVHMHSSVTLKRPYGADQARVFLNELIPAAPAVPIQIAHLAGAGGYDEAVDQALQVFIEAIRKNDKRMKNVYFDVSGILSLDKPSDKSALIAQRIRELGVTRVLYGSDTPGDRVHTPKAAWNAFRKLPLSDIEFKTIETNIAPYMRTP